MLKVYYDSEFTELSRNGELISIGMVTEAQRYHYFYAEISDINPNHVSRWIRNNVFANLPLIAMDKLDYGPIYQSIGDDGFSKIIRAPKVLIKIELLRFLCSLSIMYNDTIQINSDCLAYDWVFLTDLICGNALNTPNYISYIPIDLSTLMEIKNIDPDLEREVLVGPETVQRVTEYLESLFGKHIGKHNALFDAFIIREGFDKLR